MREVASARVLAGRGIEGDRYFLGVGRFSDDRRRGGDVTLIAVEVLDELRATGVSVEVGLSRRNLVTRGMRLEGLVGQRFRIGQVLFEGTATCEPCVELAKACRDPRVLRALAHRGGLRARVETDGELHVGDHLVVGQGHSLAPQPDQAVVADPLAGRAMMTRW